MYINWSMMLNKGIGRVYLKEFFSDEEVAFFESGNLDSLNAAITVALDKNSPMKERMEERYLRSYTRSKMARAYLDLYRCLLDATPASP